MAFSREQLSKILDEKQYVLEKVQGFNEEDEPIYAYLLLKKSQLEAFRNALEEGDIDLAQYGVIIAHGVGDEVPEDMDAKVIKLLEEHNQSKEES